MAKAAAARAPQARQGGTAQILQRSMCLTLECHFLGNNRKVSTGEVVTESGGDMAGKLDEQQFHTTKKLLDRKELTPCMRQIELAKSLMRSLAHSTHRVFGSRSYLVPDGFAAEADEKLEAIAATLHAEAVALAGRYRAAVERQRVALGPLFRAGDYVTPEQVIAAFSIDWNWVSFAAPDRLETVSAQLARSAQRKHAARLSAAFDEIVTGLRQRALEVMADLAERLEPTGRDGRAKALRGTALDDLHEFMARLPQMNLGDDAALTAVMRRVSDLAQGKTAEALKDDKAFRAQLQAAAATAKSALQALVTDGPRRALRLPGAAKADAA